MEGVEKDTSCRKTTGGIVAKCVIGAIGPKDQEFEKNVYRNKLSKFCNVSNKALALVVLMFNKDDSWTKPNNTLEKQRKRKWFTDSALGRK